MHSSDGVLTCKVSFSKECTEPFNPENRFGIERCAICLEDLTTDDRVIALACEHIFHPTCIEKAAKENCICPLDRKVLDFNRVCLFGKEIILNHGRLSHEIIEAEKTYRVEIQQMNQLYRLLSFPEFHEKLVNVAGLITQVIQQVINIDSQPYLQTARTLPTLLELEAEHEQELGLVFEALSSEDFFNALFNLDKEVLRNFFDLREVLESLPSFSHDDGQDEQFEKALEREFGENFTSLDPHEKAGYIDLRKRMELRIIDGLKAIREQYNQFFSKKSIEVFEPLSSFQRHLYLAKCNPREQRRILKIFDQETSPMAEDVRSKLKFQRPIRWVREHPMATMFAGIFSIVPPLMLMMNRYTQENE